MGILNVCLRLLKLENYMDLFDLKKGRTYLISSMFWRWYFLEFKFLKIIGLRVEMQFFIQFLKFCIFEKHTLSGTHGHSKFFSKVSYMHCSVGVSTFVFLLATYNHFRKKHFLL
jgi:hypothetical protein